MANKLYAKMMEIGVDMSWYDKHQGNRAKKDNTPTPLYDEACGMLSIYLLQPTGKLFTLTSDGAQHNLARITNSKPKREVFLCAACGTQFVTYLAGKAHYETAEA